MDLFDIARMLWRRWYVVLPIGAVTLAVALLVHVNTPPEYEAEGWLQLQTPELEQASDPTFARFDPVRLSQGITVDGEASFSVSPLEGQYFTIAASSPSSDDARAAVETVIGRLEAQLVAIQEDEGVAEGDLIDLRMASPEIVVEPQSESTFLATGTMFLYDPAVSTPNPYRPDASTGRLLQVAASGDAGRQRFRQLMGRGVTFEVGQDSRDAAALIQVVTSGSNPAAVVEAFFAVQTVMAEDLEARQARAGVTEGQRITVGVLDAPLDATDVSPPVSRAVAGIIGLGGLLALGAAVGVESLETMRSHGTKREDSVAADRRPTPVPTSTDVPEIPASPDDDSSSPTSISTGAESMPDAAGDDAAGGPGLPSPGVTTRPRMNGAGTDGTGIRRRSVHLPAPEGLVEAYVAVPTAGSGPGVIVIQDWWGVDGQVRDVTDKLATAGFVALAPNLFGGATTHDLEQVESLIELLSVERALSDLGAAIDYLDSHPSVEGPALGVVGFGMGGGLALALAAEQGDRIGAVVPYYAVGAHEDRDLAPVTASVLGHFGSDDDIATPELVRELESDLEASGAQAVFLRIHEGASHAFFDEGDYFGTHDSELTAATWAQSLAFLKDQLVRSTSVSG